MLIVDCSGSIPVLVVAVKKTRDAVRDKVASVFFAGAERQSDDWEIVSGCVFESVSPTDAAEVAQALYNFGQEHGMGRLHCVVIVPEWSVLHSYIPVPIKSKRKAKKVIENEVERKTPNFQNNIRFRSSLLGKRADGLFGYEVAVFDPQLLKNFEDSFAELGIVLSGFESPVSVYVRSLAAIKDDFPSIVTVNDNLYVGLQGKSPICVQRQSNSSVTPTQQLMQCLYRMKEIGGTPLAHQKFGTADINDEETSFKGLLPTVQATFTSTAQNLFEQVSSIVPKSNVFSQRVLAGTCISTGRLPSAQKNVAVTKKASEECMEETTEAFSFKSHRKSLGVLCASLLLFVCVQIVQEYRVASFYKDKTQALIHTSVSKQYKNASEQQKIRILRKEISELQALVKTQEHGILGVFERISAKLPSKGFLKRFVKTPRGYEVSGGMMKAVQIDAFVLALKKEQLFSEVKILQRVAKKNIVQFTISLKVVG